MLSSCPAITRSTRPIPVSQKGSVLFCLADYCGHHIYVTFIFGALSFVIGLYFPASTGETLLSIFISHVSFYLYVSFSLFFIIIVSSVVWIGVQVGPFFSLCRWPLNM
jgi:hypothetical protein